RRPSAGLSSVFAVVGYLVFSGIEKGKLALELSSLASKKWKHPISGMWITLSFSTIERWYYIVLNNPTAPICALTKKRRRDAGVPRSFTTRVRHHLARQAQINSSWTYAQHHNALSCLKEREAGTAPGYSTVRRYLKSISHDVANAKIVKLEGLVVHLRRTLIVQSTLSRLLRAPEVHTSNAPLLKFRPFHTHRKAHILSRLRDFMAPGGAQAAFCPLIGISTARMERWLSSHTPNHIGTVT